MKLIHKLKYIELYSAISVLVGIVIQHKLDIIGQVMEFLK